MTRAELLLTTITVSTMHLIPVSDLVELRIAHASDAFETRAALDAATVERLAVAHFATRDRATIARVLAAIENASAQAEAGTVDARWSITLRGVRTQRIAVDRFGRRASIDGAPYAIRGEQLVRLLARLVRA